jgi:hypothetical protein
MEVLADRTWALDTLLETETIAYLAGVITRDMTDFQKMQAMYRNGLAFSDYSSIKDGDDLITHERLFFRLSYELSDVSDYQPKRIIVSDVIANQAKTRLNLLLTDNFHQDYPMIPKVNVLAARKIAELISRYRQDITDLPLLQMTYIDS